MERVELIINKYNWAEIEGEELKESERKQMLEDINYAIQMNNRSNIIPKEFRTFNGYKPKTLIFYSNYCELESLRIAKLLETRNNKQMSTEFKNVEPESIEVAHAFENAKQRIQGKCYGRFCPKGECFETSIAVLRFISAVYPKETEWIDVFMKNITSTILEDSKPIPYQTKLYFLQTLYELNTDAALNYLEMLSLHIKQIYEKLPRIHSPYKDINRRMVENCMHVFSC